MNKIGRFLLISSLIAGLAPATSFAQNLKPMGAETVGEYRERVRTETAQRLAAKRAELAQDATLADTAAAVAAQPTSAAAPDGFGEQVAGTLTDFLPLFQFAVSAIQTGDDGKSVVVGFNPIRAGEYGEINTKAVVAKPEPFPALLEKIEESARAAETERLGKQLEDFDDITWSATYGFRRPTAGRPLERVRTLWGRDVDQYRPWTQAILGEGMATAASAAAAERTSADRTLGPLAKQLADHFKVKSLDDLTFSQIRTGGPPGFAVADYEAAVKRAAEALAAIDVSFASFGFDQLAALIHNQPQLTFTLAYRDSSELIGPRALVGSVRLEVGSRNFNQVLRAFADGAAAARLPGAEPAPTLAEAYQSIANPPAGKEPRHQYRSTFALTYKRRDPLRLDYLYGEAGPAQPVARLDLAGSTEWSGKYQYSRFLGWQTISDDDTAKPRLDLVAEYFRVSNDPTRKRSRFVTTVSYDMPLPNGLSSPISVVYANHSEFLGEPDHKLSAHVGLSLKMGGED